MNEAIIAAFVVVVAVVFIGIAVFAMKIGGQKKPPAKLETTIKQEPVINKESAFRASPPAASPAVAPPTAPPPSPRPLASMAEPSQLPPVDDSLLPIDICYAIYFYDVQARPTAALQTFTAALTAYRVNIFRLLAFDETANEWKRANSDSFRYWLAAIPLADRSGKLSADRIKLIEEEARRFAAGENLTAIFSPMEEALEKAELIDKFCNLVDIVLALHIKFQSPQSTARIGEAMAMQQLQMVEGVYVYRRDSETLFTAEYTATFGNMTKGLLFSLDAPRVSSAEVAFGKMIEQMQRIATLLGGHITDPHGEAITESRVADIRRQLSALSQKMTDFGVVPGGSTAHLIFS